MAKESAKGEAFGKGTSGPSGVEHRAILTEVRGEKGGGQFEDKSIQGPQFDTIKVKKETGSKFKE